MDTRLIRLLAAVPCAIGVLLAGCTSSAQSETATLSGTATYRERMALPADAVFEATLEDVSRADAAAQVLGSTQIESPGNPPIPFSITYDPSKVTDTGQYALRARILSGSRLLFTTDTHHPVLGANSSGPVEILLRRASADSGRQAPPSGSETTTMRGMYSYMADAGWFTDCASGKRMPVAQEGENAALESAYLKARPSPGAELLAVVDGRVEMRMPMEGPGPRETLIVSRVHSVAPGDCNSGGSTASLENTYWKLVRLGNEPVAVGEKQREPHIILQPGEKRVAGSGGCNSVGGSYTLEGDQLEFGQLFSTMMACPEGMEQERAFLDVLEKVASWRIEGERLELLDASGTPLAQFESRYMK